MQHSEKCRKRIAESLAATEAGADRIARSELRINRGIEAASRLDEPRGGEVVPTVADQAEVPHTNLDAGRDASATSSSTGPHPRDAGIDGPEQLAYRARADAFNGPSRLDRARAEQAAASDPAEEFASPDEDMSFMGSIVQDDDLMIDCGTRRGASDR